MALFPDVPEAITGGKDRTEALTMAEDALATALVGYVHAQWEIPTPSQPGASQELVAVPTVLAAKLALYSAMREQRISSGELANRLRISESAVQKLIDSERNSPIAQVQKALQVVGRSMMVEVNAVRESERRREPASSPGDKNADTNYV